MPVQFETLGTTFEKEDDRPGIIWPIAGHLYEILKKAEEDEAAEHKRIDQWVEENQGDLGKPLEVAVGYTESFWWCRRLTEKGFEVEGMLDDLAPQNLDVKTRPTAVTLTVKRPAQINT